MLIEISMAIFRYYLTLIRGRVKIHGHYTTCNKCMTVTSFTFLVTKRNNECQNHKLTVKSTSRIQ